MVGHKLGVTGAAIGHYETGLSRPTPDRAALLAKLLGLRSGDIEASARGAGAERNSDGKGGGGRKASARSMGALTAADPREYAVLTALRAMPVAERRVVMDMVLAYGSRASVAGRSQRR
jgi:transcriptional regulator with XRE-family HTH domain